MALGIFLNYELRHYVVSLWTLVLFFLSGHPHYLVFVRFCCSWWSVLKFCPQVPKRTHTQNALLQKWEYIRIKRDVKRLTDGVTARSLGHIIIPREGSDLSTVYPNTNIQRSWIKSVNISCVLYNIKGQGFLSFRTA